MMRRITSVLLLIFLVCIAATGCDQNGDGQPEDTNPPAEHSVDCSVANLISLIENAGPNGVIINLSECTYTLEEINNYPDYPEGDDFGPVGLPVIDVPVTINGFDHASIQRDTDADAPAFRLFFVTENGSLVLNQVDLYNGDANTSRDSVDLGGAILNNGGRVEINSCNLEDHHAYSGGVIYNLGGEVVLTDSSFEDNQAMEGGVLFNDSGSELEVSSSLFLSNSTQFSGAVINNRGKLTISSPECEFRENVADTSGGAICNNGGSAEISHASFERNQANSGGAITSFGSSSSLVLNNCDFLHNSAAVDLGVGGAISQAQGGQISLHGCYFNDNTAYSGGGLYVHDGNFSIGSGTSILNNHATLGGGIMMEHDAVGRLVASHVTDNEAERFGAGILNYGTLDILMSTIASNEAKETDAGGIFNQGVLNIQQSTLYENSAIRSGGGLYNAGDAVLTNTTVSNNQSESGSAIFSNGSLVLLHTTIADNTADVGAALFQSNGDLSVKNIIVAQNTAGFGYTWNCQISADFYQVLGENLSDDEFCPNFSIQDSAHLQPLADNGGQTFTHEIAWTSPARDAASDCTDLDGNDLEIDQRSIQRPQVDACDIGAYEVEAMLAPLEPPISTVVFLSNTSCRKKPGSEYHVVSYFSAGSDGRSERN